MARKAKSLKGEEVDFDLLKTKEELSGKAPILEVKDREDFVHTKRRTRGRKALMDRLKKNKQAKSEPNTEKKKPEPKSSSSETKTTKKKTSKRKIVKKDK